MSKSDIANMSVEQKLELMEQIWDSFVQNDETLPSPKWHKDVLEARANADESNFLSIEDVKKRLQKTLNED